MDELTTPFNTIKIAILDYDDTIFPTTHIQNLFTHGQYISEEFSYMLKLIEIKIEQIIRILTLNNYNIYIVTNASLTWLDYSFNTHIPNILKMLNKYNVKIISANHLYSNIYPNNPLEWKKNVFNNIINNHLHQNNEDYNYYDNCILNKCIFPLTSFICKNDYTTIDVISIGDSIIDQESSNSLRNGNLPVIVKFVKFEDNPSISLIIHQLDIIINNIDQLFLTKINIDITSEQFGLKSCETQ